MSDSDIRDRATRSEHRFPDFARRAPGYGLAIARDLVTRMGGTIWCESQPGQGATFAFRLPAFVEG